MTAKNERHITITEQIASLDVSPALQMLYAEIVHLSKSRGYCYANNQHFETRFRKSDSCIVRWIKSLEKKELIFRLVIRSLEGTERRLYIEKVKFEKASAEHQGQSLTGRRKRQPLLLEIHTGGSQECAPGVVKSEHPGSQNQTPGVVKSEHHNSTVNITGNTTVEYTSSTDVEERLPGVELVALKDKKKKKEKSCAQKEKEEIGLSEGELQQLFLDPYCQWYKERLQAKKVKLHESSFPALKRIRHFLIDSEGGVQEALATWLYILENWARLPNFLQSQIKLRQIDSRIDDILVHVRAMQTKVTAIPYTEEAIDLYKQAFHHYKGFPPSINAKAAEQVGATLTYLKDFKEGNTWEQALNGFELILRAWPELEKQDTFYKDNFTLSYIHGNTSKIIGLIRTKQQKRAELTTDSAAAWLARNGLPT